MAQVQLLARISIMLTFMKLRPMAMVMIMTMAVVMEIILEIMIV